MYVGLVESLKNWFRHRNGMMQGKTACFLWLTYWAGLKNGLLDFMRLSFESDDGTFICFASHAIVSSKCAFVYGYSCGLCIMLAAQMLLLIPAVERWMCVVMPHYSNNMRWSLFTERSRLTCQTQSISVSTGTTLHKKYLDLTQTSLPVFRVFGTVWT